LHQWAWHMWIKPSITKIFNRDHQLYVFRLCRLLLISACFKDGLTHEKYHYNANWADFRAWFNDLWDD